MWINVEESVQFKWRRAVASLNRNDFREANVSLEDMRMFASIPEFNEELIRNVLAVKYGDVSKWQLHVVRFNPARVSVDVFASSPDFEEIEDFYEAPYLNFESVCTKGKVDSE